MTQRTKGTDEKFCSECGEVIRLKAEICPKCGVRQIGVVAGSGRNRMTAALLALFLGGIGGHYFYLGITSSGLVSILFCWTLLPALDGVIHGLQWLSWSDERFQEYLIKSAKK